MVDGAVDDTGKQLTGRYKPHEVGQLTLWQLQHLFSRPEAGVNTNDRYASYLHRQKIKGDSAFETWRKWKEELAPIYEKTMPKSRPVAATTGAAATMNRGR